MNRKLTITSGLSAFFVLAGAATFADSHMEGRERPTAFPVELFTCTYNEGKDRRDLDRVIKKFQEWSAEQDAGYNAWILTPQFYNTNITFEVGWLGAWQTFPAMGGGLDAWVKGGGDISADFNRVISCDSHLLMRGYTTVKPMNETPPDTGVVMFGSCNVAEGVSPPEVYDAHVAWGEWIREQGSKLNGWAFVPDLGSGQTDFDYYAVTSFASYSDMSATGELLFNGGAMQKMDEMLGPVSECDSPRVYDATLVRAGSSMR